MQELKISYIIIFQGKVLLVGVTEKKDISVSLVFIKQLQIFFILLILWCDLNMIIISNL